MTTAPPLADTSDLATWVGQAIADGDPRAVALLSAVSALVRGELPTSVYAEWTSATTPDDVKAVVLQATARAWLNPSGATRRVAGPYAEELSGGAGIYLTADERATIGRYRPAGLPRGLGILSTTRGERYDQTVYVPTGPPPSGYPFPWYDAPEPTFD